MKTKKLFFIFSVFLIVAAIGLIFYFRDSIANLIWQKYRNPEVALFLDQRDANLAMFIGNYYFNWVAGGGEYKYNPDLAKKAYEKAILINPKISWGHYQLGRIYFIKGDFQNAGNEINKELEFNPGNFRCYYMLGLVNAYSGNLADSENNFREFLKWVPKEWAGYNDLAWVLSKQGKYSEAKSILQSAFKNVPDAQSNPWLWNALGLAQLNLKDYSSAKNSFENASNYASQLTLADWVRSYPGNDPATAKEGLKTFKQAIQDNLSQAQAGR